MNNQTKKKSHIQETREQYAKNTETLIAKLGEEFYWNLFLDTGLKFLELQYKGHVDQYYYMLRDDASFWNWFNLEYKLFENGIMNTVPLIDIIQEDFELTMMQLAADEELFDSFHCNYLKLFTQSR